VGRRLGLALALTGIFTTGACTSHGSPNSQRKHATKIADAIGMHHYEEVRSQLTPYYRAASNIDAMRWSVGLLEKRFGTYKRHGPPAVVHRPSQAAPLPSADETWVEVPMQFSRGTATVRLDFKPNLTVSGISFSPQLFEELSSPGAASP
jgi:hypothetical protein